MAGGVGSVRVVVDVDFRILAALARNPFLSHAAIARVAGTSASTVRRRAAALGRLGVLRGLAAVPAAEVFGREAWVCDFRAPRAVVPLRDLLAIDDVVWADRNHDGSVAVMSYLAPGSHLPPSALVERLGEPSSWYRYPPPAGRGPPVLSPLDWRVLAASLAEPRAGAGQAAARAGLSPKTVRKRKAALVREGLLDVFPRLGPAKGPGPLYYHLAVLADSPRRFPAIVDAAAPALVMNHLEEPAGIYLFCRAESLPGQLETQRLVAARPGVREARLVLNVELEVATARLEALVAAELARWESARAEGRGRPAVNPPRAPPRAAGLR